MVLQRVRQDWVTNTFTFHHVTLRRSKPSLSHVQHKQPDILSNKHTRKTKQANCLMELIPVGFYILMEALISKSSNQCYLLTSSGPDLRNTSFQVFLGTLRIWFSFSMMEDPTYTLILLHFHCNITCILFSSPIELWTPLRKDYVVFTVKAERADRIDTHKATAMVPCVNDLSPPWMGLCLCMLSHSVMPNSLRPHGL